MSTASSLSDVAAIAAELKKLQQAQVTTVEAHRQWTRDYQHLSHCFERQWIVLDFEKDDSSLLTNELQQLCSSWWVFSFLTWSGAEEEDAARCTTALLQAGQPLLLLSVPSAADEAQKAALQSAARETCVVWDSLVRIAVQKAEARLTSSASQLPPWRAVAHLCDLEDVTHETALLLPAPGVTAPPGEPSARQELLMDMATSLKDASARILSTHVQRVFHGMLYPSFHPVDWQTERVLESSMARTAGVHPCVWMLFYLCRVCVCRAHARDGAHGPPNRGAALFVLEYCHGFMTLIDACVACPAEAWQDDAGRRQVFLTDVYVAVFLCRLLRGVWEPVERACPVRCVLEARMLAVLKAVEHIDAACRASTDSGAATAVALSETELWKSVVWPVAPLTCEQLVSAASKAPWGETFAAASAMASLLSACTSAKPVS